MRNAKNGFEKVALSVFFFALLAAKGSAWADVKSLEGMARPRSELLAMDPGELRRLIQDLPFKRATEPRVRGLVSYDLTCPDGHKRTYWIHRPLDYDPGRAYPMLVMLPGGVNLLPSSEVEGYVRYFQQYLDEKWRKEVFLMALAAGYQGTSASAAWWYVPGLQNVLAAVRDVKSRHNIDDDRVFLTGMSDGGSGTYAMAFRLPDAFAGFCPLVGNPQVAGENGTRCWMENLKGTPIRHYAGARDPLYPGARMKLKMEEFNKRFGTQIQVQVMSGGHDIDFLETGLAPMLAGMAEGSTRNLLPERIDWSTDDPATGRRGWISIDRCQNDPASRPELAPDTFMGTQVLLGVVCNPASMRTPGGVVVNHVNALSVGQRMGVLPGDRIVGMDGRPIDVFDDLVQVCRAKKANDAVDIDVIRAGERQTLKGTYGAVTRAMKQAGVARAVTTRPRKGEIRILTQHVGALSVWVAGEFMGDQGELVVYVNDRKAFEGKVSPSAETILSEYERTLDRRLPFIARIPLEVLPGGKGQAE